VRRTLFAAGMMLAAVTSAGTAWAAEERAQPSEADIQRAQAEYAEGMERFEAGEFKAALERFERSYAIVKSPNAHFMMARSMAGMGENELAYRELSRVIREAEAAGERYAATAESARAKREEIRPRIGLLRLDASALPKGSKISIEGEPVAPDDLQDALPVLPGDVRLRIALPDGEEVDKTVFVETGGEKSVRLGSPRETEEEEDPKTYIERDGGHFRYLLEVVAEGFWTTIEPPGLPNHGGGPGLRVVVQVLPRGIIPGLNDSVGVGGGVHWAATSLPDHLWFPIHAQWNLWITPELSAFVEPGIAIMTEGGGLNAHFMVGGRYMLIDELLAVTVRGGIPHVSAGVSAFF
jgi:hypothetical protein